MSSLLTEIEAFLEAHNLPAWRFGIEALGDKHFVKQLRAGRRCWPETESKVRLFMAGYKAAA